MKKWIVLLAISVVALMTPPLSAEEKMSHKEILGTIVEVANENGIPAEIMIAIASKESGDEGEYFRHYDENGEVIVTDDGGIGLMQITELRDTDYSAEELEDIENNIRAAADVLNAKWGYINRVIPELQTWTYEEGEVSYTEKPDRDVLEHWYFPVMAYNGLVEQNIPKESEATTYQDDVFESMADEGLLYNDSNYTQIFDELSDYFEKGETYYTDGENGNVSFPEASGDIKPITLGKEGTYTRMNNFEEDELLTFNRNSSDRSYVNKYNSEQLNESTRTGFYNRFSVVNKPLLFTDNQANHYGYYTVAENGEEKFISSTNLINSSHPYATTEFASFTPEEGEQKDVVSVSNDYVTIDFNEEIAERYVNQRNFYLTDSEGNGLRASIVKDDTEIRLTPISTVTAEEIYTLHVHKVRDNDGNMASAVEQKIRFE